jgi:very-short-patch-repair endonuclease
MDNRGEFLVAIMNNWADFRILSEDLWYRIPVASCPKPWPPTWLGFYQTKVFKDEAFAVKYYGRVRGLTVKRRHELFPNESPNPKSDREYFQIHLHSLDRLSQPIYSRRLRRIVFIPTTRDKFHRAVEINDLYDESPLEDRLWAEFKRLDIAAERQWYFKVVNSRYYLDFAVFCQNGAVDIEADGDTWHTDPKRVPQDNQRFNDLQSAGWRILRFNGEQIRNGLADYCVPKITEMINSLGGLREERIVSRTFYPTSDGIAQQLALFEEPMDYDPD